MLFDEKDEINLQTAKEAPIRWLKYTTDYFYLFIFFIS